MRRYWLFAGILLLMPEAALAQSLPTPATDDLWDVSQGVEITSSTEIKPGADARDALGGTFGGLPSEAGNVVYQDNLLVDTAHALEWKTPVPIQLESFRLFAWHRTSRPLNSSCTFPDARVRGFKMFKLYAKNSGGSWDKIYELDPLLNGHYHISNPEYQGVLQFDRPTQSVPFLHEGTVEPVNAQEFRAEFIQGGDPADTTQCALWRQATGPRVVELDGFGTIAPPEPDEPEPVVIVPGMLVSISPLTTFLDQPSNYWTFTLGARGVYSSLIKQFELAGMFENEDVFVAHYDWRKPVNSNVDTYLKPIIDKAKEGSGSDKVDIVAHSMGGLLARSYIQGDNYENDVDQLITLGTPHEGAADAYVAWEGGDLPITWSAALKMYVNAINSSLLLSSGSELQKPQSYRTYFPSLRDLLPINPYIVKNDLEVEAQYLTEQNNFLRQLNVGIASLEDRGVDVTAIVGTDIGTLRSVVINDDRTNDDVILERWRDGHPEVEPILPNDNSGDQRVLTANAGIGDSIITIPNGQHDKLPSLAREEILDLLGIYSEEFSYEPPDISSMLGIVVLSPVDPKITCGEHTLSKNENAFPEAEYAVDPSSPDSPKILAIGNPPEGKCEVYLTGTGNGPYEVITTYSDSDETISTVRDGTTNLGKVENYDIELTAGSFQPPVADVVDLLCELPGTIQALMLDDQVKQKAFKLHGIATRVCSYAKNWQKESAKKSKQSKIDKWRSKAMKDYKYYSQEFKVQTNQGNITEEGVKKLLNAIQYLEEAGWQ